MLLREARLRPEWGELYPAARPGQWESAAVNGEDPEWPLRRVAPSAGWALYYADSILARKGAPR